MLELAAIDAGYGTFQALFGVSLEVRLGEAVAVIGPNGAGKTTLMRLISGLKYAFPAVTARTAFTTSLSDESFSRYPRAPAFSAFNT